MFSAWTTITIRFWEAVIMWTAAKHPPCTVSSCSQFLMLLRRHKTLQKTWHASTIFFLGSHQWPVETLKYGCNIIYCNINMVWQKAVKPRCLLSDLLKIQTNQLSSIHAKLPHDGNTPLFSCRSFCEFKRYGFLPIGFLCSHCPLWRWIPETHFLGTTCWIFILFLND